MTRSTTVLTLILLLSACSESVSPRAERVFYRGDGEASWGTVCKLNRRGFLGLGERGYVSVAHVTENGTPLVGPKDAVTASDLLSDWSFLGIDPMKLDAQDYPEPRAGMTLKIHGFPARDRDGEVVPGVAYLDDPEPPFWWIELHDSDDGIAAEGVIGGFSGSCVFDEEGALVAVVHANGFSPIGGTTNTFAKVVPVREAILQAQNRAEPVPRASVAATLPAYPPMPPVPPIPDPAPDPTAVMPPLYVEVPPTYLDVAPTVAPPPVADRMPAAGRITPPALPEATWTSTPVTSTPAPPPVYRRIVPAPRGAYRPRGIECADCI